MVFKNLFRWSWLIFLAPERFISDHGESGTDAGSATGGAGGYDADSQSMYIAGSGGGSNFDDNATNVIANERGTGNAGNGKVVITYFA